MTVYADVNNPALLFDEFHKAEAAERETEPEKKDERPKDPDDDALAKIKSLLNPRYTTLVSKRDVFVPEILVAAKAMKNGALTPFPETSPRKNARRSSSRKKKS